MHTRGKPESFVRISDTQARQDTEMGEAPPEIPSSVTGGCLVLAIDFGTTFSSVAFRLTDDVDRKLELDPRDINCIKRFPYDPSQYSGWREEVPTVSCYSKSSKRRRQPAASSSERSSTVDAVDSDADSILDLPSENGDATILSSQPEEYLWGYRVQREGGPDVSGSIDSKTVSKTHITRSKLILDDSELTADIRAELQERIESLKGDRMVGKNTDIIIDFLTRLLQHTKSQLIRYHNFDETIPVEFVVCVPVAWKNLAWRKMHTAVTQAVKKAAFSELSKSSVQDMFMVSEPEAAAASVLSASSSVEVSFQSSFSAPQSNT
jgi:hypothetical protein